MGTWSVAMTTVRGSTLLYAKIHNDQGNNVCRQSSLWLEIGYNLSQFDTIRYNAIQYDTIRYNTMQYDTMRYNKIQNKVKCNIMQYNTIHSEIEQEEALFVHFSISSLVMRAWEQRSCENKINLPRFEY